MFSRKELCNILCIGALLYALWMGSLIYNAGLNFPWGGPDFARSYSVSEMLQKDDPAEIYNTPIFIKKVASHINDKGALSTGWLYPPIYSMMLQPLAYLPYKWAFFVSALVQVGLFFVAGYGFLWRRSHVITALFSSVFMMALFWGQNSVFIAALYISAFRFMNRNQVLSGIMLGSAIVKPQLGVLIPIILIMGEYYITCLFAVACILALGVLTTGLYGMASWEGYLQGLLGTAGGHGSGGIWEAAVRLGMPSIYTWVHSLSASELLAKSAQFVGAVGSCIALIYTRGEWKNNPRVALLYLSVLTLFATPYLGIYDYVLAITMIVAAFFAVEKDEKFGYAAAAVAFVLPFVSFIHVIVFVSKGMILAPLMMAFIGFYVYKDKRLHFPKEITLPSA